MIQSVDYSVIYKLRSSLESETTVAYQGNYEMLRSQRIST